MKRNADEIFKQIAKQHHITVEEVKRQIGFAMLAGMCNPDPNIRAYWEKVPHKGDIPTPEELILYLYECEEEGMI